MASSVLGQFGPWSFRSIRTELTTGVVHFRTSVTLTLTVTLTLNFGLYETKVITVYLYSVKYFYVVCL